MSYLESTLSLNFSSCHLGNMHNRECFINYLMAEGKELGSPLVISMKSQSYFTSGRCRGLPWAQLVKNPLAMQETWIRSLSWEDPLEKAMATHSSILA